MPKKQLLRQKPEFKREKAISAMHVSAFQTSPLLCRMPF